MRARVYEHKRLKEVKERSELRKEQMGTGERSEKIRTYNFPQVHTKCNGHICSSKHCRIVSLIIGHI